VRLIEAGATPLGPFVYLTEDGRDIQTVLCRCMASEVDNILGLGEYELLPLDELAAIGSDPSWTTASDEIGTLLRFPTSLLQDSGPEGAWN
jgi:hypothetical protein